MKKVGVIGLGHMGKNMARNLIQSGKFDVMVYDIFQPPVDEMRAIGARGASSLQEIGSSCDIIFVMVMNFEQVSNAAMGSEGCINFMKKGSTIIVTSTIAPSETKAVAQFASERGVKMVDAPVSGGVKGADAGTLVMMVACEDDVWEECREAILTVGSRARKVGTEIGIGQVIKAANQLCVTVNTAGCCEALVLAAAAGANVQTVYEIIRDSAGGSFMFNEKAPQILERDFATRGALTLQLKDTDICLKTGRELGVSLPATAAARELFIAGVGMGFEKDDLCSVVKVLETTAGVTVKK